MFDNIHRLSRRRRWGGRAPVPQLIAPTSELSPACGKVRVVN